MNNFRIEKEAPNNQQWHAAWCQTIEIYDYIVATINRNVAQDRDLLCAANILTYPRLKGIIASSKQDIYRYAPSKEDEWFYERCCKRTSSRAVFEGAAQLIRELDTMKLQHGYAMVDEVTEAVRRAALYILAGAA